MPLQVSFFRFLSKSGQIPVYKNAKVEKLRKPLFLKRTLSYDPVGVMGSYWYLWKAKKLKFSKLPLILWIHAVKGVSRAAKVLRPPFPNRGSTSFYNHCILSRVLVSCIWAAHNPICCEEELCGLSFFFSISFFSPMFSSGLSAYRPGLRISYSPNPQHTIAAEYSLSPNMNLPRPPHTY